MKTKLFLFVLIASFFAACEDPYEQFKPHNPSNPNNPTTPSVEKPNAAFGYEVRQPLKVKFQNKSRGANSYKWDFGDGTTSRDENPTHRYEKKGIYKVTLTATYSAGFSSASDKYISNVTIEDPTKIYLSGFQVNTIPYQNEYYYVRMIDDDFFTTQWAKTYYFLVSSANLPYSYIFETPKLLDGLYEDDYYDVELYYNTTNSGNGTKVGSYRILTNEIYKYPEEITGGNNNFSVTTYFSYK